MSKTAGTDGGSRGWSAGSAAPTTLVLVRHGVTALTLDKRFSGGIGGTNPPLAEAGRDQAREAGQWLKAAADRIDAVLTSPVLRTIETAEIIGAEIGHRAEVENAFAEMEFGEWDGLTFAEVAEQRPAEMKAWLGSLEVAPAGGESFRDVEGRVLGGLNRVLAEHAGRTIVVVSHVTPIKIMVGSALGAPLESVYRMELSPASVSVISHYPGGEGSESMSSLRLFNARPGDLPLVL
ncbi:histidine phosphatase family protein [Nocardioides sp. Bht2]|uniref:histidine phosphatase family protein n=1 Tax=Nocardioides sp. Bht2 TaxID=3392297 RepID=UPI0039B6E084